MLKTYGAAHLLFVTLTFPEHVSSAHEAHAHLNSFLNKVRPRYEAYLWVLDIHQSGAIHYHLLIATKDDIYKGTYVSGFEKHLGHTAKQRRQHMNPSLRSHSDWFENEAPKHQFGRVRVEPIYSEEPIAAIRYLCKERWLTVAWPFQEPKYVRFWSCTRDVRAGTINFSWVTEKARAYRAKLREWTIIQLKVRADDVERIQQLAETAFKELRDRLGRYWFFDFRKWLATNTV